MIPESHWRPLIAALQAANLQAWHDDRLIVRRISGGANNALYRVDIDGRSLACKLCVNDDRRRAAREFHTMCLLHKAGLDIAPSPLSLDETCRVIPFPVVTYEWLEGESMRPPFTEQQFSAVLDRIGCLLELRPSDFPEFELPDTVFHWFDFRLYVDEQRRFLADYGPWLVAHEPDGRASLDRLTRLVARCAEEVRATRVDPGRARVPLRLCRADWNLANAIACDDGHLRWVDWEYAGWGDPALELSDLRWHASLADWGDDRHAWLRENVRRPPDDDGFEARLRVWDHILSARWPFLILRRLWSQFNGPDRLRLTQSTADVDELRGRLALFIERAERVGEAAR